MVMVASDHPWQRSWYLTFKSAQCHSVKVVVVRTSLCSSTVFQFWNIYCQSDLSKKRHRPLNDAGINPAPSQSSPTSTPRSASPAIAPIVPPTAIARPCHQQQKVWVWVAWVVGQWVV
jgi:hypothetical protein